MPQVKKFKVFFQNAALVQLQSSIDHYNQQQAGLGKRFANAVKKSTKQLEDNPFFQLRYDSVRCLPLPKFPYMLHFIVNEDLKTVRIYGVLHTSLNPNDHWK
jgi:hypothetical protein